MVMLLSLLCITVSGSCSYHLSVISISWSLQMLQWRYAAALLCLEMYSVLANTSHPDTIWSTISSCCEHILHLLSTCWPHITFWLFLVFIAWSWAATSSPSVSPFKLFDNHLLVVTVSTWGFSRIFGYWPCNALFFHFFIVIQEHDFNVILSCPFLSGVSSICVGTCPFWCGRTLLGETLRWVGRHCRLRG